MAIEVVCDGCGADYSVPDSLAGKTIKCKACAGPMPVAALKPTAIKAAVKPAVAKPVKAVAAVADDDDYEDDRPTPRGTRGNDLPAAPKKASWPLVVAGLAGVSLLFGVVAAGLTVSGALDSKPPVAMNPPFAAPVGGPAFVAEAPPPDDEAEVPKIEPKVTPKKKPAVKPPVTEDASSDEPPPDKPQKAIVVAPLAPAKGSPTTPLPAASGGPRSVADQLAITRAKEAAVFIEIDMNNGSASGSGWFGVEQNLIFTNAHVLDMTAPNASKPKKITVYINPGTNKERIIPHSKLEILAVDRFADLAILRVMNETNLPTPLKIRASAEIRDVEPLVVIGYPSGRGLSMITGSTKAPQVSVNVTSFSTNRLDNDGNVRFVQYRGGGASGNSGGPVVDYEGNVVAVHVARPRDPNLVGLVSFGVPTEMVSGLLAGRIGDVEYGQAYRKNGKVMVPVKMNVLDPFQRLKEVGITAWVGDPSVNNRMPGAERTGVEPSDGTPTETKLSYKWTKDKQTATGEIEYPELQAGRAYWSQPFYRNALTSNYWMSGRTVKLSGPPVDLEDADLMVRLKIGSRRPTTLLSSGYLQEYDDNERNEPDESQLVQTEIKATETVQKTNDQNAIAQFLLSYETLNWKAANEKGEREDILGRMMPKEYRDALSQNLKVIQGLGFVRKDGTVYKTLSDLRSSQPAFAPLFRQFSDNAMHALEGASVPLPNAKVSPNHTWKREINARFQITYVNEDPAKKGGESPAGPGSGRPKKANKVKEYKYTEEVTYTYLGTRTRVGQKEAVIRVEGVIKPAAGAAAQGGASGSVKGYAYVDLDTGTVLESELKKEFEMDSSSDGARKVIASVSNFKITRGTAQ